jgi:hypothetical protein
MRLINNFTQKTKDDGATRTPLKPGGEHRCSGRVSSSCSTCGARRVTNPMMTSWMRIWPDCHYPFLVKQLYINVINLIREVVIDILDCLWFIIICHSTMQAQKKRGKKERKQLTTHFPETGTPFSKWTLQDYQNIILIILIKY